MPKLSVCIEMFWRDLPYEERIRRVAQVGGYPAVEFWGWSNKDVGAVKDALDETGLEMACMSFEPSASLVKRGATAELVAGMRASGEVAQTLGCKTLIVTAGNTLDDETYEITRRRVVRNWAAICQVAEDMGLTLVIEPLNTLVNHHGYWLTKMSQAADIVQEVDSPASKILMDLYHQQITEGNNIENLRAYIDLIGHFHAAGVPGRNELVGGEQDYGVLFKAIDLTGYDGYVGLEYRPTMDDAESLRQTLTLLDA